MKRMMLLVLSVGLLLVACSTASPDENNATSTPTSGSTTSMGPGMGMQSGMMARHQAPIPEEYKGLTNPVVADEASLERGAELFATYCAACHGDGGMGDGPASAALDPAPAPIAHTSQMMGDDYLFWRVSEGGALEPFNSGMPTWKNSLDEQERWDVLNYVQALGSGTVMPQHNMGGAMYDAAAEAEQRATMLNNAVDQAVITQAEANLFTQVHNFLDAEMAQHRGMMSGSMADMQAMVLEQLVNNGTITQTEADTFNDIHNRLIRIGVDAVKTGIRNGSRKSSDMAQRILVVDDEKRLVQVVRGYLEEAGFEVVTAYNGRDALFAARDYQPNLIILDLMMPEMDGWAFIRQHRREKDTPIIVLTARVEDTDKVAGLELGADDYVTKPFSPRELVARVRARLRRVGSDAAATQLLRAGSLELDPDARLVRLSGAYLELTKMEFDLLLVLMNNPGRAFNRLELLERTQGFAYDGYERTVDVHIKNLRKKIEPDPAHPQYILTAFGVGYRFNPELP